MEMNYKFTTKPFGQEGLYGVKFESLEDSEKALFQINSFFWNDTKNIDDLIDSINSATDEDILDYQVEGGHLGIMADNTEVAFFNLLDREKEEEDFSWTKDKFITFLQDFKTFVEENS